MNALAELFVKGGPVMWPLSACWLIGLTVSIERAAAWLLLARRGRLGDPAGLIASIRSGGPEEARELCRRSPLLAAEAILVGLDGGSWAMERAANALVGGLRRGLGVLDTVITVAPLLGILGTVTGIIQSFHLIGLAGTPDPRSVSSGIAEALITTAFGLIIAIACLIPYNFFAAQLQRQAERLSAVGTAFERGFDREAGR